MGAHPGGEARALRRARPRAGGLPRRRPLRLLLQVFRPQLLEAAAGRLEPCERYQGFFSEEGLRDCHNAYARFLLRGFKGVPGWDADDERVSETPEDEAESAHAYAIWGIDDTDPNDFAWEPREAPIEGRAGIALRSGKRTRPHAHSTPSYPEIRKHQLDGPSSWRRRPAVPSERDGGGGVSVCVCVTFYRLAYAPF